MSSSEEDLEKFQDCVFQVPLANDQLKKELPSNRKLYEDHQTLDYKSLRVTPTFQKHVSKHLDALLNDTKFVSLKGVKRKKKKKSTGGILLLHDSSQLLDATEDVSHQNIKIPKRLVKGISDKELERRAKAVAVSGQYILSKKEVANWAPETRGTFEIIKSSCSK